MAETILIQFNAQLTSKVFYRIRYFHTHREDNQVKFRFHRLRVALIRGTVAQDKIVVFRVFAYFTDPATGVYHAIFFLSSPIIFLVTFAVGAGVNKKYLAVHVASVRMGPGFSLGMFNGHDGFFGGIHAAY